MITFDDTAGTGFYGLNRADAVVRMAHLRRRLAGLKHEAGTPVRLRVVASLALLAVRLEAVAFRVLSDRLEGRRS